MNLKNFTQNWNRMQGENLWSRMALAAMAASVLLLTLTVFNQKPAVMVLPPQMSEEGELMHDQATQSFHESWSHHVARTIGNVSPDNAKFVRGAIEPLLAPSIYEETLVVIERQLDEIQRDNVAYTFEPREIVLDSNNMRTYVTGMHFLHQGRDSTQRFNRTYEFEWEFDNYRPMLIHIETYEGGPRYPEDMNRQGGGS